MKVKHIIISHIALSVLLISLIGCEKSDLDRKIEAFQKAHPDREGDCVIYAMRAKAKYDRLGIPSRHCHGYHKGKKHDWVEYEQGDRWLVDDKSVGNKGWEREEYGDYELIWWGE